MDPIARAALRSTAALVGAGVAGVAYAGLVERTWFTLRRFAVPVLPVGAEPVRVLQVSDLHLTPGQSKKIEWVRSLAALRPDFVVNSGDNLAHVRAVPPLLRAMEPLMEFPGAFVLGSNDYYAPMPKNPARYLTRGYAAAPPSRGKLPVRELVAGLEAGGWSDLDNARTTVTMGAHRVELVGVNDPHVRFDRYDRVAGPARDDVALTMGLVHAPYQRVLDAMTADGAGLVLAGHTHGGQLAVPFYGALVTNCDLDTGRVKGVSRWWPGAGSTGRRGEVRPSSGRGPVPPSSGRRGEDRPSSGRRGEVRPSSEAPADAAWLHVSAGLGTSPYAPVRFACRPEATLLTLVAREP